ncbi:MAG: hypothetical protein ABI921_13780 [Panacibacter sp.]
MTKFVVFTTPRTGSSLLVKTLDTHPAIFCAGELFFFKKGIFHTEAQYPFLRIPFIGNKLNYLVNYPFIFLSLKGFLNKFYDSKTAKAAAGFKLMHFQTYYTPGVMKYLQTNQVKTLVLIRKNVLRNTLSDLRARSTKVYHNEGGNKSTAIPKFKVDIQELAKKMQQIGGFNRQLENDSKNLDRKIIYYEDFENWDAAISGILQYLNVDNIPLQAASKKLNPEKLEDMLENYAEVSKWLNENGYSKYLD